MKYIGAFDVPDMRSAEEIEAERLELEKLERKRAQKRESGRREQERKRMAKTAAVKPIPVMENKPSDLPGTTEAEKANSKPAA